MIDVTFPDWFSTILLFIFLRELWCCSQFPVLAVVNDFKCASHLTPQVLTLTAFPHVVRTHIHAGNPAQLCDSGDVPALWRHQLPVRVVPRPTGWCPVLTSTAAFMRRFQKNKYLSITCSCRVTALWKTKEETLATAFPYFCDSICCVYYRLVL